MMLTRRRKRTVFTEVQYYYYTNLLITTFTIILTLVSTSLGVPNNNNLEKKESDGNLGPTFDLESQALEIDARFGQTVLLPCTVRNLRDKVVSWIRTKDLHILTSGIYTFSSDNRFEAVHQKEQDFWGLRIRGVGLNDTGQYECQVNTDPKMSLAVKLNLPGVRKFESSNSRWISRALIKGPTEVYVGEGSPVTFTCEISPLPISPGFIPLNQQDQPGMRQQEVRSSISHEKFFSSSTSSTRWLHDDVEIQNNAVKIVSDVSSSYLNIPAVKSRHAGRYTCMQPSTMPDTVRLYVVEAEHSEAMQRDYPIGSRSALLISTTYMNIIAYFVVIHYYLS